MCRMAAYIGPEILLEKFLLRPPHSLMVQSWKPQELNYATMNADGYGFGWYNEGGEPAIYTNPMPIWSDSNLPHLAGSMYADIWLANIRSATPGLAVNQANTQPFYHQDLMFMHNGFLRGFSETLRPEFQQYLAPEAAAIVQGNTDSEYLFALLCHFLQDEDLSIENALSEMFALLEEWLQDLPALLNLIISDGERLYATRHAENHECPSLYFSTDDEDFPDGQLIASERMTTSDYWQPVPEHHLLIISADGPPEIIDL